MKKNNESIWFQTFIPSLTLFTSFGTLVCCALPALMVTLGMGTTLAGFIGMFPSVTFISDYKEPIFIISGMFIILGSEAGHGAWQILSPKPHSCHSA